MKLNQWILIFLWFAGLHASAQTSSPVVDLNQSQKAEVKDSDRAEMLQRSNQYYQMQVLQEEVRTLRGTLEEINYELQQIKQRQMDDYLDIDRRLTALVENTAEDSGDQNPGVDDAGILPVEGAESTADAAVVRADYDRASGLLLKNRDLEGAIEGFSQHVEKYPDSPFVANAYYWLGEIYDLRDETELALQSFRIVVDNYADHSKAMDAQFKLGKLYHKLGQIDLATQLLQDAAAGEGGAAAKARAYLDTNDL